MHKGRDFMNGPQLEDGYTRIANEILEVVSKAKFNGTQYKILITIWRYTYGFNRKEGEFSLSFLSEATNCNKQQVKRELDRLIENNVITVVKEAGFNKSRVLRFNKHYTEWSIEDIQAIKESTVSGLAYTTVSEKEYSTVSGLAYQERQYKDNIKERVVVDKGVPSPETTNPDKVPSHCQDDDPVLIFLNQVSSYYTTLTGRFTNSNDEVAITEISNLTVDFELVKQAMDDSKQSFKPKYDGDKIRSFSYFVPAIKAKIAVEEARQKAKDQPERREANGPAPGNAAEYFKKNKDKFLYKAERCQV